MTFQVLKSQIYLDIPIEAQFPTITELIGRGKMNKIIGGETYKTCPLNQIIQGDALEELKKLSNECVDLVITSPPYFNLRNYGVEGQIGVEKTEQSYIETILKITKEIYRVIKNTGSFYLNLDDTFSGSQGGNHSLDSKNRKTIGNVPGAKNSYPRKSLLCIPFRIAIKMIEEQGYILRNDLIWYKPNAMPENIRDRFVRDFEYIFFFTKKQDYFFNLIKEPYTTELNRWGGLVNRGYENNKYKQFARKRSYRPDEKGRLKRSVWRINTNGFSASGEHIAPFPEVLVKDCIEVSCPKNGVILDPFLGSGTTAVVARQLGRNYIGIELSEKYIKIAERRLSQELLL